MKAVGVLHAINTLCSFSIATESLRAGAVSALCAAAVETHAARRHAALPSAADEL